MRPTLPDFAELRVAVLGDGIADHYVTAHPSRLSREAPVLVLRHAHEELRPGGAANVARNLAALGARVAVFGVVGDDEAGIDLRARLAADGVDVSGLVVASGWTTPTKTRFLAGESHRTPQQVLRIDREPDGPPPERALEAVGRGLGRAAHALDALVVSDYGYGALDPTALAAAADLARRGLPVVVDPRARPDLVPGPMAITPNLDELAAFAGSDPTALGDPRALAAAALALIERSGARWCLATLGNRGMALFGSAGERWAVPVSGREDVVDVSGAGDTVAAVFGLALAAGRPAEDAMAIANAAAGLVVLERGTVAPDRRRLAEALVDAPVATTFEPADGAAPERRR